MQKNKSLLFKKRKNYRRKRGHRQSLTRVRIGAIAGAKKPAAKKAPAKKPAAKKAPAKKAAEPKEEK